jgi:nucleotide sugar dehydrogenase
MTTKACHIPKIVSGMDVTSLNSIIDVYSEVFDTVVPVSSLETAEMCKLYENCFRMINISYVNEISDACIKHGIDCNEMIKASTTKGFGFMPFYPSLYVGGSCIPNNCRVLLDKCENLTVLRTATESNEHRPLLKAHEIVRTYANANDFLIIGIGFKVGESVLENSPGL